ncbi:amidohydrolase family protein [Rhodocytophaga rosea]|uniref:Amidohydrolase family protein n=1 Tax=Rhodocytophaga rosea TaxID=2704465 RepID=A0A6C0GVA4_9BACT|nr:amidohydrolase family protein [Rhodocytophaga rosea]QHT71493.1 amidohydrolase family protein [Rhodocytophaga rosea]
MISKPILPRYLAIIICLIVLSSLSTRKIFSPSQSQQTIALVNGQWFTGKGFESRTGYSVNGRFTFKKPKQIDQTIDLAGTWLVPPFGEAHNHNIDGVVEERSKKAIERYMADGVFYVKIQGNYPLTDEQKNRLQINQLQGPDVAFAHSFFTVTGGHPMFMHENILLSQGYYPGFTKENLQNKLYFTIESEKDLEDKWPQILALHPDFIKTNLWCSDEFEKRKNDPAYLGRKALDPRLLPKIVAKAHANKLRVSVHITNAADFHNALLAGVDEIAHSATTGLFKNIEERGSDPRVLGNSELMVRLLLEATNSANKGNAAYIPISEEDAKLAAKQGTIVITTMGLISRSPEPVRIAAKSTMAAHIKLLSENGVNLVIGSDNVMDTSVKELEGLKWLGVFDNLTLLKMWAEDTPKSIFPDRKIGRLQEGYEASFVALDGNPLEDLQNIRKIKHRFKQGVVLEK